MIWVKAVASLRWKRLRLVIYSSRDDVWIGLAGILSLSRTLTTLRVSGFIRHIRALEMKTHQKPRGKYFSTYWLMMNSLLCFFVYFPYFDLFCESRKEMSTRVRVTFISILGVSVTVISELVWPAHQHPPSSAPPRNRQHSASICVYTLIFDGNQHYSVSTVGHNGDGQSATWQARFSLDVRKI